MLVKCELVDFFRQPKFIAKTSNGDEYITELNSSLEYIIYKLGNPYIAAISIKRDSLSITKRARVLSIQKDQHEIAIIKRGLRNRISIDNETYYFPWFLYPKITDFGLKFKPLDLAFGAITEFNVDRNYFDIGLIVASYLMHYLRYVS